MNRAPVVTRASPRTRPLHMLSCRSDPQKHTTALVALGALGYGLRLVLWLASDGSNDIRTWRMFAQTIRGLGLEATYRSQSLFNHPPLMGLWSLLVLRLSDGNALAFSRIFKVPSLLAELLTGLLLVAAWKNRGDSRHASAAFAAYGTSLSCILISGFHGNTDAVFFCLAFASAYLLETARPGWAGLALGAALNVKLIPILLVPPFMTRASRWSDLRRFLGGLAVGVLPFVWALTTFTPEGRRSFIDNIFMYHSNLENWGVELAVRWAYPVATRLSADLAVAVQTAGTWYASHGGVVLLVAVAAVAAWNLWIRRAGRPGLDAYRLAALAFILFLLLGSGFGVQYVGCVVAPLLAWSVWDGTIVSTTTGLFIGAVYLHFVVSWSPIATEHLPIPRSLSALGVLAWVSLAAVSRKLVLARQAPLLDRPQ